MPRRMVIYLSGGHTIAKEELTRRSTIMLTFAGSVGKSRPQRRLRDLIEGVRVRSVFMDSGSFTLWKRAAEFAKQNKTTKWAFYETDEHWEYLDEYTRFLKQPDIRAVVDLCANVDVIPDRDGSAEAVERAEELSWRNQQYLEKRGLDPIPAVHYRADLKWLNHYIELGYERVALGGLVGSHGQEACRDWIDRAFDIICDTDDRTPCILTHGFGVTSHELLFRYPWATVDSTSWIGYSIYGAVVVPRRMRGSWEFCRSPHVLFLTEGKLSGTQDCIHLIHNQNSEFWMRELSDWLQEIDVPLGDLSRLHDDDPPRGVVHRRPDRVAANFRYYERLQQHLPEYPWSYQRRARPSFGFVP